MIQTIAQIRQEEKAELENRKVYNPMKVYHRVA
jgi:hypothetical protein